ncbi:flagellar M-ring protein FliF [Kineobactrum sediminis]|uniref:Flagellar M-ring protein n=1 Tax=Kineobactrum sediminis TaxID=1905677 RepID=A0A2N5Y6E7_9GAMM|nr:flagellar basal-body MS-ring/collar protein FliF [Kineobactrum sediminis]PLW83974.1 flagellar M-ring protein FliF [Kineobactrum sediminis]
MAAQDVSLANSRETLIDQVPGLRQLLLLVGIAGAVAIGVWVVLWSQDDAYSALFTNLADRDAMEIVQVLESSGIPHRYESGAGVVMVPAGQVHTARLQLASQSLPNSAGVGFEMLNESNGISDSQFIETARYQRALEVELQRTIASINAIGSARVHLAVPRQTVFVRNRAQPGASVLVNLYPGRRLEPAQVASIVNLVASSVTDMERSQVTVVDQNGNLLSVDPDAEAEGNRNSSAVERQGQRIEERLKLRIEELLTPIVGSNNTMAQVAVSLNPETLEETQELYDPDNQVVRSEQNSADPAAGLQAARGIPGALANQPPVAAAEPAAGTEGAVAEDLADPPLSTRSLRNYEIGRTVRYIQAPMGSIRRLNVAVVLNQRTRLNDAGETESVPYAVEELAELTELVRQAVGFEEARGDAVTVIGADFLLGPEREQPDLPEPSFLDQFNPMESLRILVAVIVVLLLIFTIIRPTLRQLLTLPPRTVMLPSMVPRGLPPGEDTAGGPGDSGGSAAAGRAGAGPAPPSGNQEFEQRVSNAKAVVNQDPKRVAQVVRDWVNEGE